MTDITTLVEQIQRLSVNATGVAEESFRITIEGDKLNPSIVAGLSAVQQLTDSIGIPEPTILISERSVGRDELAEPDVFFGEPWRLVIGKTDIAKQLRARDDEFTVLFFSIHSFESWLKGIDPFVQGSIYDPNFSGPTTIRVVGLEHSFGGPWLWVLPINNPSPDNIPTSDLPESSVVHSLIHINADRQMSVCPKGWALSWGNLDQSAAIQARYLSEMVLSACLVQEIKYSSYNIVATLRGTKFITLPLPLISETEQDVNLLPTLIAAVEWVYAERPETRIKLVTDRLSIDIQSDQSLHSGMQHYLREALTQARDSYAFVILERKDAYHKEMRELMKDMKSQADLYAAKVRELVSSLTRDILGVLVFLGFSFIGKFDPDHLTKLLDSRELSLLMKFMAGYLILSCILQLFTHWRDAKLSYDESQKWISVLQNYTSSSDNQKRFIDPINRRKITLYWVMIVIGVLYISVAISVWNLPIIAHVLLVQ